jgi:hypothetical protein
MRDTGLERLKSFEGCGGVQAGNRFRLAKKKSFDERENAGFRGAGVPPAIFSRLHT